MPQSKETVPQTVRRHLGNGLMILRERGAVALYGAAMREAAKLIDSPVGAFLAPRDILRDGPDLVRSNGLRSATGAVFRQVAATYDPPLGRNNNPVNDPVLASAPRYHYTYELTKLDGVVPARRPVNDTDFALAIPFAFAPAHADRTIAAVVHAFYPDVLEPLLARLETVPGTVDLFISTDTDAKRADIAAQTALWRRGTVDIRVLPNRGRDIAAKFVGFRDVYERYDLFIHLHTKRSPHGGTPLARWRDYLVDNLLGSPEIIASVLHLFDDPKVGIVFPQHLFDIRGIINWGYDYPHARDLMRRMGVAIDKNLILEFPSGSMFWGRCAAIRPLLDIDLQYADFPDEAGQVDGTIAHAIERIVLMAAESAGYEWLKVVRPDLYPLKNTVLRVAAPADVGTHRLKVFQPCLSPVDSDARPYAQGMVEIRPIATYPSRNPRARLTLIVPTVNPHQAFGGIATALKLFGEWTDLLGPDVDRRIVATDAEIEPEAYAALPGYEPVPFIASIDDKPWTVVDASGRSPGRLDVRAREIFIATAWWTAELVRAFGHDQARYHGRARPFVYLIQDDEPYFQGWGSRWARAAGTYADGDDTIAVINSEELFAVMTAKHRFRHAFCLPYAINARISAELASRARERMIIAYARPYVDRNAFELICDALVLWQQRDPVRASRWRLHFLGDSFATAHAYPVQNVVVEGKVSLATYADYLSRASVGISLMISPHPSYPPLEMAEAGLLTITNGFSGKDLRGRFPAIVSLDTLRPDDLARAIEDAVVAAEPAIGSLGSQATGITPPLPGPMADPRAMADLLRGELDDAWRDPGKSRAGALT